MKTLSRKRGRFTVSPKVAATMTSLFLAIQSFAQNVSDSDLSNSAGTNKNWYGSMWFFGVVIALVIVIVIAFARKRKRSATDTTHREHRG